MKTRKSPRRHQVQTHVREGRRVRSYLRGHGVSFLGGKRKFVMPSGRIIQSAAREIWERGDKVTVIEVVNQLRARGYRPISTRDFDLLRDKVRETLERTWETTARGGKASEQVFRPAMERYTSPLEWWRFDYTSPFEYWALWGLPRGKTGIARHIYFRCMLCGRWHVDGSPILRRHIRDYYRKGGTIELSRWKRRVEGGDKIPPIPVRWRAPLKKFPSERVLTRYEYGARA